MATRLTPAAMALGSGSSTSIVNNATSASLAATLPSASAPRHSFTTTQNTAATYASSSMLGVSPTLSQAISSQQAQQQAAGSSQIVPNPSISERLSALSAKFEGFHHELDLSRNQRKLDDQRKLAALQSQINSLRDSLTLESKNRATAMKALQAWLEDRIQQWAREVQLPLHEELKALSASVNALTARTQNLETLQEKNKDLVPQLVELRSAELRRQIEECKTQVEQEHALRVEREKRVYAKIQDLGHRLREQLVAEKQFTDRRLGEIRTDIDQSNRLLQSATERVAQQVSTQDTEFKNSIRQEGETRAAAVDELARAVSHYGTALQAGIKIVSQ